MMQSHPVWRLLLALGFMQLPFLANAFEAFSPNCTLPSSPVNYVSAAPIRSTMDIVWSCLAALLLCTWSVQHVAVPTDHEPPGRQWLQSLRAEAVWFLKRLKLTIIALFAPEFIFGKALAELLAADESYRQWGSTEAWTTTHAFFANMRGFVLRFRVNGVHMDLPGIGKATPEGRQAMRPRPNGPASYEEQDAAQARLNELVLCRSTCHPLPAPTHTIDCESHSDAPESLPTPSDPSKRQTVQPLPPNQHSRPATNQMAAAAARLVSTSKSTTTSTAALLAAITVAPIDVPSNLLLSADLEAGPHRASPRHLWPSIDEPPRRRRLSRLLARRHSISPAQIESDESKRMEKSDGRPPSVSGERLHDSSQASEKKLRQTNTATRDPAVLDEKSAVDSNDMAKNNSPHATGEKQAFTSSNTFPEKSLPSTFTNMSLDDGGMPIISLDTSQQALATSTVQTPTVRDLGTSPTSAATTLRRSTFSPQEHATPHMLFPPINEEEQLENGLDTSTLTLIAQSDQAQNAPLPQDEEKGALSSEKPSTDTKTLNKAHASVGNGTEKQDYVREHSLENSKHEREPSISDILPDHEPWEADWALSAVQLRYAAECGLIEGPPPISAEDIKDRSKGDTVVKLLAVGQLVWLMIQIIARAVENLAISLLEISTLAFVGCGIVTYAFLLHKPQDVKIPYVIHAVREVTREDIIGLAARSPKSSLLVHEFWIHGVAVRAMGDNIFPYSRGIPFRIPFLMRERVYLNPVSYGIGLGGALFGAIHCAAWNLAFPTPVEQLLWRVASVILVALPLLGTMQYTVFQRWARTHAAADTAFMWLLAPISVAVVLVYLAARIYLLVEALRSLAYLDLTAFQQVVWPTVLPFVS